jgi:hypothetical protein
MGETIVKGLEKSADLVFVGLCPREYYYGLAKIEGRSCCRFFVLRFIIFSNISWKLLSEEIPLQAFVHVGIQPHVNKPPGASQVADGFTKQKFLTHLVQEMDK